MNLSLKFLVFLGLFCVLTQNKAIVGTSIGGWMVLEPWITPSLFYRFLNKTQNEGVAMDSYSLCEVLGPEEGNKLMRAHWDTWFTEDHIKQLSLREVEMVRLPIGDWTLNPYGPYIGCMDGAADKIQWMFDICQKYNIKILLDVHAMKGSQNGFDNSGKSNKLVWTSQTNFSHWANLKADWMGQWNNTSNQYDFIDDDQVQWSVDNSEALLKKWGSHPAFGAFEPVNEPWWNSNMDVLKDFYRQTRKLTQQYAPNAKFVFHNAFNYNSQTWNDLFADDDHENVVMDHHYYQAWNQGMNTTQQFCDDYERNAQNAENFKYDVWFGEWALATDVCAMWLGGFNDANTSPQFQCEWVDCPRSYLPEEFAIDFDRSAKVLGPFGTGNADDVTIHYGKCSKDSKFFTAEEVKILGKCAQDSMNRHIQGQFLWTAHNEIEEKWDYVKAYDLGWIGQSNEYPQQ